MNTFKRKAFLAAALAALAFTAGCASDRELARAQADAAKMAGEARVMEARAAVEEAKAVQALAAKIDSGGASAYLIARAMKGLAAPAPVQVVQQPQSTAGAIWQAVLQVADVALRGYGIKANRDVAVVQSNNQAATSIASYRAFVGMGDAIRAAGTAGYAYVQAPGAVTTTTTTTTNTLSGTGVLGSGTYTGPVTRNCNGGTGAAGGAGSGEAGSGGQGGGATGGSC